MDLPQIKAFIDAMASSDLTELEVSKDGWTLRLQRGAGQRAAGRGSVDPRQPPHPKPNDEVPPATAVAAPEVFAPLSGVVYLGPAPNQPPFVVVGQRVTAGTAVCVIEAMKTFNEIRAERDGIIEAILVASETLVDAGQLLMRIT